MGIDTTITGITGTAGSGVSTPADPASVAGGGHRAADSAVQRIADASVRMLFRVSGVRC